MLQAVVDLVDCVDAAAAAQSQEQRNELCQQQGQLLQWLRHKLPTNADVAQVMLLGLRSEGSLITRGAGEGGGEPKREGSLQWLRHKLP